MTTRAILEGVRVIDASTMLAAPLTTNLLGDFGAEVIKVEAPKEGDQTRKMRTNTWKVTARNKKSVTLDFRKQGATDVFYRLVQTADLVVTNFRPSTLRKWNIDYDDLRAIKPDLLMFHLSAFGRSGPKAETPGFARIAEAYSGLAHLTGYPDRKPVFSGYPMADAMGGVYGAYACMLALYDYKRTGQGQLIDLALYEPLIRVMEDQIVDFYTEHLVREREGTHNPRVAPNDIYESVDGVPFALPASTQNMFRRLVSAIGLPELAEDPRFETNKERVENRVALDNYLKEFFDRTPMETIDRTFQSAGIAHSRINSVEDIVDDAHIRHRKNIISVPDPATGGFVKMQSVAPILSETPGKVSTAGPALGSHNTEIYRDFLGYTDEELRTLKEQLII